MSSRRRPRSTLVAIREFRLTPARYRMVCVVALGLLVVIVVSGAAVRLTGSGLGCDDWPNCNESRLVDVSSKHAAIEQINRLFTGLVSVGVILAVLGALRRAPRRRDLTWLSLGLVAGVLAQIVLGGITVLVDLHPAAVQGHLLVSMALVANAVVLVRRAGEAEPAPGGRRASVVGGTIVTGAGPHAGDEEARRFDVAITTAVRVHSVAAWVAVAVALLMVRRLTRSRADRERLDGPLTAWIITAVLQGLVGYIQYFSDVPPVLVGLHVAGATTLWGMTVWMLAVCTAPLPASVDELEVADELGTLVDHAREEVADTTDEVGAGLGAPRGIVPERQQ